MVALAAVLAMGCSLVNASDQHTRGSGRDAGADAGAQSDGGGREDAGTPDAGPLPAPRLRVAHLARDTGPIDVYANDRRITESLGFSTVGTPGEVPEGEVVFFRVTRAGTEEVLVQRTFSTALGREYTLAFHGDEQDAPFDRGLELLLLEDDASGLDIARNIRLAVIHVATPVVAGQLVSVEPDGNVLLANDFGFEAVALLPALPSRKYTVGFDAGADGVVDVFFDLPTLVPGTYANVFVATRPDDSVYLLVNTRLGATLEINGR
jgi:hypothetical protein